MRRRGLITALAVVATACARQHASDLQVLPEHFLLQPGERIHYTIVEHLADGTTRQPDATFTAVDGSVVKMIEPAGVLEAVKTGRTELVARAAGAEKRVTLEVSTGARPALIGVPYRAVPQLAAREILFVGHANLDGFDHTAVAKRGIDRVVQHAKKRGWPVVYWVSRQYPNWYTEDRDPDYTIVSEGQEHLTRVAAERVTFTGGSFMFCLLRNVQMTLHGMLTAQGSERIDFAFPSDAIWVEDMWGPGEKRPYPAPMILLSTLLGRRSDDDHAYREVVVPFLDRVISQFPVAGYPADAPTPPLSELLKDWSVVVRLGGRFERMYRRGDSRKTWLLEFYVDS